MMPTVMNMAIRGLGSKAARSAIADYAEIDASSSASLESTLPSSPSTRLHFHFIRDALSSSQLFARNNSDENTYDRLPPAALAAIGVVIALFCLLLISIATVLRRRRKIAEKRRRLRFYFMTSDGQEKPSYLPSNYPFTGNSSSSPTSSRMGPRFSPSVRSSLHYGGAGGSGFAYMEREMVEIPPSSSLPTEKGGRDLSPNRGQRLGRVPRVSRNGSKSSTHSTRSGRSESESGHLESEGISEKSSRLGHGISMSESDLPGPLLSPPPAYNNKVPDRERERRSGDSSSSYL